MFRLETLDYISIE